MSLTTLPSLRWSWCVDTVVGQACQRVGCTVCGSHVKHVVKLVVESPATVGLGLCSQLFIMSLTTLPSLRWSLGVDTVVGQACQRVGCAVTDCGSPTVGLGLCSQLFIMSLTALPALRWSLCVDTVVGQVCQRVGCTVTACGSHVKRVNALSLALLEQVCQPGAHVLLCLVGIIPSQLPFMMSFIDSLFTAPELSTLKTWVVRSCCKVEHTVQLVIGLRRILFQDPVHLL